jgi:hypothetical protein
MVAEAAAALSHARGYLPPYPLRATGRGGQRAGGQVDV